MDIKENPDGSVTITFPTEQRDWQSGMMENVSVNHTISIHDAVVLREWLNSRLPQMLNEHRSREREALTRREKELQLELSRVSQRLSSLQR